MCVFFYIFALNLHSVKKVFKKKRTFSILDTDQVFSSKRNMSSFLFCYGIFQVFSKTIACTFLLVPSVSKLSDIFSDLKAVSNSITHFDCKISNFIYFIIPIPPFPLCTTMRTTFAGDGRGVHKLLRGSECFHRRWRILCSDDEKSLAIIAKIYCSKNSIITHFACV